MISNRTLRIAFSVLPLICVAATPAGAAPASAVTPRSPPEFDRLARVIDDPAVEIGVLTASRATATAVLDEGVLAAVQHVTNDLSAGVKVVPAMSSGASDNVHWRATGIPDFGVSGMFVNVANLRAHGNNERIGVTDFHQKLEFSCRLMRALAGR